MDKLTYPTAYYNNITPIIIDLTLSHIIPEVRLRDLIPRVNMNPKIKCPVHKIRDVHPLAIDIVMINIETTR